MKTQSITPNFSKTTPLTLIAILLRNCSTNVDLRGGRATTIHQLSDVVDQTIAQCQNPSLPSR